MLRSAEASCLKELPARFRSRPRNDSALTAEWETDAMLQLDRCTIRRFALPDAPSLAHYANNRKVWRNMRDLMPHPYALADAEAFLGTVLGCDRPTHFAIDVDGAAVGGIGVRLKGDIERVGAELGYWLGEPFWNRGILSEAVPAFTRWALAEFELTRIEAIVFEWNPASARVLEKAGFVLEGTLRQSAIKDGQLINRWMYAYYANESNPSP
jgi:ribosomal-protein-alanine N-acetyltransferase